MDSLPLFASWLLGVSASSIREVYIVPYDQIYLSRTITSSFWARGTLVATAGLPYHEFTAKYKYQMQQKYLRQLCSWKLEQSLS